MHTKTRKLKLSTIVVLSLLFAFPARVLFSSLLRHAHSLTTYSLILSHTHALSLSYSLTLLTPIPTPSVSPPS
ncbi:hypothetical protein F5Y14DRAFT_400645 [Nemania sp. NC0429]|nr:hypothetical protein F5Y14DRAFT_400645 [Nemania sp. NC0429]